MTEEYLGRCDYRDCQNHGSKHIDVVIRLEDEDIEVITKAILCGEHHEKMFSDYVQATLSRMHEEWKKRKGIGEFGSWRNRLRND